MYDSLYNLLYNLLPVLYNSNEINLSKRAGGDYYGM